MFCTVLFILDVCIFRRSSLRDWNNLDRGVWLTLGLILSIAGVNASVIIAWNWYYALDKKEI